MRRCYLLLLAGIMFTIITNAQNVSVTGADATTNAASPFATLAAAFTSINAAVQAGNIIVITILNNTTEPAAGAILNNGNWSSITIKPQAGFARTITGAITAGLPLIDLNGADNVTIDGLNSGGSSLTISNTTNSVTPGTSTIRFQADATNNLITRCSIQGSGTMDIAIDGGVVWFAGAAVATGNDNNIVSFCNIGPAGANLPTKCFYFTGTSTNATLNNSGITISNNNIFDYFNTSTNSAGVYITTGSRDISIINNRLYQTAARTLGSSTTHSAIRVSNSSGNNYQVTGNIIGFASSAGTGVYTIAGNDNTNFVAIGVYIPEAAATSIQGNIITAISQSTIGSTRFFGITGTTGHGDIGTITGNTIGSLDGSTGISVSSSAAASDDGVSIYAISFGSKNVEANISNNIIGNITGTSNASSFALISLIDVLVDPIYPYDAGTAVFAISNNTIGSPSSPITNNSPSTSSLIKGINYYTGQMLTSPASAITGNTIRNLVMSATNTSTSESASVTGIMAHAGGTAVDISGNTISSLTNTSTSGSVAVTGISYFTNTSVPGTTTIARNFIHSLGISSTFSAASITGIVVHGGSATYLNNMIRLGIDGSGASMVNGNTMVGIDKTTGDDNNFFHNSIYIGGINVSGVGTGNTFAFRNSAAGGDSIINNIFVNARSNSSATGKHYNIGLNNSATAILDFNAYYGTGSGFLQGYFGVPGASDFATLALWKSGTYLDGNSVSGNPQFINPTISLPNLHISAINPTPVERAGIVINYVTNDFDGQTRSGLTPVDIGADAGSFSILDLSPPAISYTLLSNSSSTTNRSFTNVIVTDATGVNGTAGTRPRVYFKRSTDANTVNNNTSSTSGWKYAEANGSSSPFDFTINYSLLNGGTGVSIGNTIQYFVVAQDNAGTVHTSINAGAFAAAPLSVALTGAAFPIGGTTNSYPISQTFSGNYNVGAGQTYTTLTNAGGFFAAINGGIVTGNITVNIVSSFTEDATNALSQWDEEGAGGYTLTIQPNAASERIISGNTSNAMIRFNGADRVTVDGRFTGSGKYLRFRNTNTSRSTFRFLNSASNNTIRNCNIESANEDSTSGTIVFSTSNAATGNSNNTIINCNIRDRSDASGVPANAIYSSGTAGASNASNTISDCNIFNWTNAGVLVTSSGIGDGWIVSANSYYQPDERTTNLIAISIRGGNGHSIINNNIGGSTADAGGSPLLTSGYFSGISLTVGTASPTSVQGNTIKNITSTGFVEEDIFSVKLNNHGIVLWAGLANIGNITGNTIGSVNADEKFVVHDIGYGIRAISESAVNLHNNTINNFRVYSSANLPLQIFGISAEGEGGIHSVINNTVMNVTNHLDGAMQETVGMIISATGIQAVRGNTISDLGASNSFGNDHRVWGLIISGTAAGTVVEKNSIYNIHGTFPNPPINQYGYGNLVTLLELRDSARATCLNNMIAGGSIDVSNPNPTGWTIFGIHDLCESPAINYYYYNSVNITGATGGSVNTYAFRRSGTATVNLINNIFSNTRSGGTGFHVAIANTNPSATWWPSSASNYNDLYSSNSSTTAQWLGSAAVNNRDLAGWKAAQNAGTPGSGGDANSIRIVPGFISSTDLHIQPNYGYLHNNLGTPISFDEDIDGDNRNDTAPDMGADEFTGLPGPAIIYTALGNHLCLSSRVFSGIDITDPGTTGVNMVTGTKPRLYFKKSTDANTYSGNTSSNNGWKYAETTSSSSPFSFTFDYSLLQTAIVSGDVIQYFVVAQDLFTTPNVAINQGTFTIAPTSVALTSAAFPITGTINNYAVIGLSGTVTVGPAGGNNFSSLTAAGGLFESINASGLTGNLTAYITGDISIENGANSLSAIQHGCGNPYTLTIKTTGDFTISGSSADALIRLDGADRVTIDGSTGSTANTICGPSSAASRELTIINTNTSTSSAVIWLTGNARNNIIENCIISGSGASQTMVAMGAGSSIIGTFGSGNSNNSYINNAVKKAKYGIFSGGTSGNFNTGTVINQNRINFASPDNISNAGIYVGYEDGVQINGNAIGNIAGNSTEDGIGIALGRDDFTFNTTTGSVVINAIISKNVINTIRGASTYSAIGIGLVNGLTGTSEISNNMVSNVLANGTGSNIGAGIFATGGTGATNIWFNTVSMTGTITGGTNNNYALAIGGNDPEVSIRNNILVNSTTSGTGSSYAIGLDYSTYSNLTSNRNDFFTSGAASRFSRTGSLSLGGGNDHLNLLQWQGVTAKDINSKSVQPVFVSASDLHLVSSDASNLVNLESQATAVLGDDIDCLRRYGLSADIGADEFAEPFTNDEAQDAITLTVNTGCVGAVYTNVGATKSTNEAYPSCSGIARAPVWFKFLAPASGAVRVSSDMGSGNTFTNSKIGLFSTSNYNDYSTFTIISCDEDGGSVLPGETMSVLYATGLTYNQTYWIAVDKFSSGTSNGTFCIAVDELNSSMIATVNNCSSGNYKVPVGSNTNYTGWVPLLRTNSKLIAMVKNSAGGAVDAYTISQNINSGPVRQDLVSKEYYLNRNYSITNSAAATNVQAQLFFLDTELAALYAMDSAKLSSLRVTRQASSPCHNDFIAGDGINSELLQTGSSSLNGLSWVNVTTPSFSNFYIHSNRAPVIAKTFLQGAFDGTLGRHRDVTSGWASVLNNNALVQPYDSTAFGNYNGGETVPANFFTSNPANALDITDWVLLEIKDVSLTTVYRRAALVREDGKVVDINGDTLITFNGLATGNYYLTIRHRNHLGVSSQNLLPVTSKALGVAPPTSTYDFDFTTATDANIFGDALAFKVVGGANVMIGGNANSNGNIRYAGSQNDPGSILTFLGGSIGGIINNVYSRNDLNMNGTVRYAGSQNDPGFLLSNALGGSIGTIINEQRR